MAMVGDYFLATRKFSLYSRILFQDLGIMKDALDTLCLKLLNFEVYRPCGYNCC